MIKEKNLSVIICGRYEKNTKDNALNIRKVLPKAEIILSTYKEALTEKEIFEKKNIKLLINKDYGDYKEFTNLQKNLFRMMKTFLKGLKKAKRNIILKIRTDYSINYYFRNQLKKTIIRRKKIFFLKKNIRLNTIYSTQAAHFDFDNFHFSDQVLLSTKNQFLKIFNVNKKRFLKKKNFSKLPKINGKWGSHLASEQIIWINFLRMKFQEKDAYKIYENRNLHNQIFKNIKIMDEINFIVPKRLNNFKVKLRQYAMNNSNLFAIILRYYYFIKNN